MHDAGYAYQKKGDVNWDPVDQTVLANEQVFVILDFNDPFLFLSPRLFLKTPQSPFSQPLFLG